MAMHADALVIMAKAPIAGQSKTRLVPPLSPEEAAELSRCLFLDLLEDLGSFEAADRFVAFFPAGSASFFEDTVPSGFARFPQYGRDLGERMKNASDDLMKQGYQNVVLIGSDVPVLPRGCIAEAFSVLRKSERLVLGPSRDGGYYLIGLNRSVPDIFERIAWSSEDVLAVTTQRLAHLGIESHLLLPWFDIDTFEDLCYLKTMMDSSSAKIRQHTLRFLRNRLGRTPHQLLQE